MMVGTKKPENWKNEQSIFEGNEFIDGFIDWMDSPSGQLSQEVLNIVWEMLEKADVDAKNRKIIWPDRQRLSIDSSIQRIYKEYDQYPVELIEKHLIGWLEMEFAPESYSQEQLDELDVLTEKWINDHYNKMRNV
jgi:hypothetical protein